jgi:hypothetical protein
MGIGGPNIGDGHPFASFFWVHQLIHSHIMEEEPQQYLAMMEMFSLLSVVHPCVVGHVPFVVGVLHPRQRQMYPYYRW